MFPPPEKIVVVTRKTSLEELVERHNPREQARFYVEARGATFADYEAEHDSYQRALETLRLALSTALPPAVRVQWIKREFLPQFVFGERDLVVALGPDGLVVNIAKYLETQVLVAFNPDPARYDGVLLPFAVWLAEPVLRRATRGQGTISRLTMARCVLNDGQEMLALNDLFLGRRGHASARYELKLNGQSENQSSSGIIVSTGAGSTGWLRSIVTGAARVMQGLATQPLRPMKRTVNAPVLAGMKNDCSFRCANRSCRKHRARSWCGDASKRGNISKSPRKSRRTARFSPMESKLTFWNGTSARLRVWKSPGASCTCLLEVEVFD